MTAAGSGEYPRLSTLIDVYFGEEFSIWGDTIPEIIASYKRERDDSTCASVVREIDDFIHAHASDLDEAFSNVYGFYLDPEPWGHTAFSFLDEVRRLLTE